MSNTEITRYKEEDWIVQNGENIVEIQDKINTEIRLDDGYYTVQEGDDIKNIAENKLGDARLYWIICEYNDILSPFLSLPVGKVLRIPSLRKVRAEII